MSEIHGATGSYAVDALDPAELDEFEAHLAVCPTCRQEVVEFCETAAELSLLAAAPAPPPALRGAVLAGIGSVRQLPPLPATPQAAGPGRAEDQERVARAAGASVVRHDPVADELAVRREHRRTRVLTLLVAAVTVLALALGGVVVSLVQGRQAPVVSAPAVDPSLLSAPDAQIRPVQLKNGAHGSFVVSKAQGRAVFVSNDLPSPGPGNVYQLWTLKGKAPRADNTLDGGSARSQTFTGPVADSTSLAVNIEPAGSTPSVPTNPILASATI